MSENKYAEIIQIGSTPISADNPVGEDVVYDHDYELVEGEIKKLQSLTGGEANWNLVVEKSTDILSNKSKDLSVAAWLCLALFNTSRFEGLSAGLNIYFDLVNNFWGSIYPARIRRRANTIEWLFENINKTLLCLETSAQDNDNLISCNEYLSKLTDYLDEKLGNSSPYGIFREIKDNFSSRIVVQEEAAPVTEAARQSATVPKSAPAPIASGIDQIIDAESADKALKENLNIVKKAANILQNEQDTNPLYYRLIRISTWGMISNLPMHTDSVTPIPEIQSDIIDRFKELEEKGEWNTLLKRSETQFLNTPFWLDLQRYTAISAENLGGTYKKIQDAVCQETLLFIDRFPDLRELKFAGGTPFANEETKLWLETLKNVPGNSTLEAKTDQNNGQKEQQKQVVSEVRKLLVQNKLQEAVETWYKEYTHDESGKENFIAKLELAKLFVKAKKNQEAIFQLEVLDEEIKSYNLEKWDPKLSAEVIKLLLQAMRVTAKTPEQANKLIGLKKRLYKLDPASALSIN